MKTRDLHGHDARAKERVRSETYGKIFDTMRCNLETNFQICPERKEKFEARANTKSVLERAMLTFFVMVYIFGVGCYEMKGV